MSYDIPEVWTGQRIYMGQRVNLAAFAIETPQGVTYEPWTDGYAVGFRAVRDDGKVEYLFLNPSSDSDDGQPNIFLYHGPTPEEAMESGMGAVCFIDMFVEGEVDGPAVG